jgi:pimeloyl-ACP methyl ester carboxylesterase
MVKKALFFQKILILSLIIIFFGATLSSAKLTFINENKIDNFQNNINDISKIIYEVPTQDRSTITLTRYIGAKSPPIILIHGMGGNHKMYDFDQNHSLPRFLARDGWDVWLLDLRTHDGDGDFFFVKGSDRERINRYWDFDRTYLKIDVVTAVDFVKKTTGVNKIILSGHSYGGYLAYAYAEIIGEENLAGIMTTGASPYANPVNFQPPSSYMLRYGFSLGRKAFVNPFGMPWTFMSKFQCDEYVKNWKPSANAVFYYNTTPEYIQKQMVYDGDSEPAGVWVDMFFGKDPKRYNGHWVDPQTLYDYSALHNK